jgi:hypothetical protein
MVGMAWTLRSNMSDPIMQEIEWEQGATDRGVRRYRETMYRNGKDGGLVARPITELEPGQVIMRDVVHYTVEAIHAAQREAADAIVAKGKGRWDIWWWPILCLKAEQIAVIAVRTILSTDIDARGYKAVSARGLSLTIGRHMKTQREFEMWRKAENERERAARKERAEGLRPDDEYIPNWWKLMSRMSPEVNERAFRKWSKKSDQYDKLDWTREMRLHVGMKVLGLIVEYGGGWFEMEVMRVNGGRGYKTERRRPDDRGRAKLDQREAPTERAIASLVGADVSRAARLAAYQTRGKARCILQCECGTGSVCPSYGGDRRGDPRGTAGPGDRAPRDAGGMRMEAEGQHPAPV